MVSVSLIHRGTNFSRKPQGHQVKDYLEQTIPRGLVERLSIITNGYLCNAGDVQAVFFKKGKKKGNETYGIHVNYCISKEGLVKMRN